jgi:ferredoxin
MLVINPKECIDCNLCVAHCPIDAIFSEDTLPQDQQHMLEINAKYSKQWPVIIDQKDPPIDSDDWIDVKDKLQYLEE